MILHGETIWEHGDDVDQHIQSLEKLRVNHNQIFKKVVFAQRDDKQDYAVAYAIVLTEIRTHISRCRHMNMKMKWGEMYSDESYF